MRQQYRAYTAEKIKSTCSVSVAEQEIVLLILNTIICWAQRVQSIPEVMFKFVKIECNRMQSWYNGQLHLQMTHFELSPCAQCIAWLKRKAHHWWFRDSGLAGSLRLDKKRKDFCKIFQLQSNNRAKDMLEPRWKMTHLRQRTINRTDSQGVCTSAPLFKPKQKRSINTETRNWHVSVGVDKHGSK